MADLTSSSTDNHLRYLDSARGIAALMVFVSHFIDRGYHDAPATKYVFLIFNGNDAVSFFFVLSGFVLSYKYMVLNRELDVKKFFVSRIFRLFPAYFITVVLNTLMQLRGEMGFQRMVEVFLLNKTGFWEEALLLRFHNNYYFPGWTLSIEMLCSFLMPFFMIIAMKDRRAIVWLFFVLIIIGNSIFYSSHFIMGLIVSCYYVAITNDSIKKTKWFRYRYFILPLAAVLFSIRRIDMISPLGKTYKYLADYASIDLFLYTGIASFVFLVAILQSKKAQRFLSNRPMVFLGKISFSIYLLHTFAINIVYLFIKPNLKVPGILLNNSLMFICYIAITILMAMAMHKYVEIPFISMGRRVAGKMKPSLVFRNEK